MRSGSHEITADVVRLLNDGALPCHALCLPIAGRKVGCFRDSDWLRHLERLKVEMKLGWRIGSGSGWFGLLMNNWQTHYLTDNVLHINALKYPSAGDHRLASLVRR